jgi:hypothetical protein
MANINLVGYNLTPVVSTYLIPGAGSQAGPMLYINMKSTIRNVCNMYANLSTIFENVDNLVVNNETL